jgi:hypothetical protein
MKQKRILVKKGLPLCLACLFVLAMPLKSSGQPASGSGQNIPDRIYDKLPKPEAYSLEKPAYCYFEKLTIGRINRKRLSFTIEVQGELPPKEDRQLWYEFSVDIDKSPKTGNVPMDNPDYGRDILFWVTRGAGERKFAAGSGKAVFGGKEYEIEVKSIDVEKAKITFVAESELFNIFPSFRFYLYTALKTFDPKNGGQEGGTNYISMFPSRGVAEY